MPKQLLCADDSVTMQKVVEITFTNSDFAVRTAKSADEALTLAKQLKPDLVLADAIMPGKTGYDLCQALKSDPSTSSVPVLILCGNSQAYDEARGKTVGADGFLPKPWDTQQMVDKCTEFLAKAGGASASPSAAAPAPMAAPPPSAAPPMAAAPPKPSTPPVGLPAMKPAAPAKAPVPAAPAGLAAAAAAAKGGARSATIMGMPAVELPPGSAPTMPVKPAAIPGVTPISPAPAAAKPAAPAPAPAPAAAARAPMIQNAATTKPSPIVVAAKQMAKAAAEAAAQAGLDPNGAEMVALTKLSREVIEKICWELVPELAESIIKEHVAKLPSAR